MEKEAVSEERILKYLDITKRALESLEVKVPEKSHLRTVYDDFLNMATSYYSDAKHFYEKGELVDAFACVNYAHGWLDAGARLGLFNVEKKRELFTID
jgi:hypothetical protein